MAGKRSGPGRNDPCPCGSGRKYKHCHLHGDEQARAEPRGEIAPRAREFHEVRESILGARHVRSREVGPQ